MKVYKGVSHNGVASLYSPMEFLSAVILGSNPKRFSGIQIVIIRVLTVIMIFEWRRLS